MTHKQGDIVLIPVPYTDLTTEKKRPVLVLSNESYNKITQDIIVVAITSNIDNKGCTVKITDNDMKQGNLLRDSCIRADKIYTLSQSKIIKKFGTVKSEIILIVIKKMLSIFEQENNQ